MRKLARAMLRRMGDEEGFPALTSPAPNPSVDRELSPAIPRARLRTDQRPREFVEWFPEELRRFVLELLQGRLSDHVLRVVTDPATAASGGAPRRPGTALEGRHVEMRSVCSETRGGCGGHGAHRGRRVRGARSGVGVAGRAASRWGGAWTSVMCGRMPVKVSDRRANDGPTHPTFVRQPRMPDAPSSVPRQSTLVPYPRTANSGRSFVDPAVRQARLELEIRFRGHPTINFSRGGGRRCRGKLRIRRKFATR